MKKEPMTIKTMRILNGLSQKQMGEIIGVSQGTYQQKETGNIKFSLDEVITIKRKFNIESFDDFKELNY